jgi:hypothetical protein
MEGSTDIPEVRREVEREVSETATRGRPRAPAWVVPTLAVLVIAGALYVAFVQQPAAIHLIVIAATLAVVIGLIIAVNPNRRSPAGGTRRR